MSWLEIGRHAAALVFVLALIGLAAWGLRRLGPRPLLGRADPVRLRVVETLVLDPRRRLLLIRRDEVEHLLVLGPEGTTVVEGAIGSPHPAFAAVEEQVGAEGVG